ncbi:branched-chain amino acid ABC transporter permease [Solidesulfovibrio magneticus]|uniref:ABC transporter permease protein n=1 Tax=Solidesulfovibrio magneticus (strain ATCC 700980 / DSM 13731 / RS-1) TaxID=573370 RepID=C4XSR6_SOLM1|nr:branched-chain amino acid ABC transporter permease [Solidesulfovibrio magneticus]BAH75758.1 ABC transporter permease protein [Solidesulfovibrio magneticus RS-1]
MSRKQLDRILLAVVALAAFGLPLVVTSPTYLQILILLFFYAYLTTAWNLVGGFAGVLPLGHSVFVGIGAYTSSILTLQYGVSPWIGMLVGGAIAAVIGVIIGLPTFRMRGAYFCLCTIAFAEGIRVMVENIDTLGPLKINGPRGLLVPLLKDPTFWDYQFMSKLPYYYIILVLLILVLAFTWFVSRSKIGYYLAAGGEEPDAAAALGINVANYKLFAMALSCFLTALAGTFYAQLMLYFYPKGLMGLDLSFEIAFIALIGGRGTIAGPVIGALLLRPLNEFTRIYLSDMLPGLHLVIFGLILILVMIYLPKGLTAPLAALYDRLARKITGQGAAK